MSHYLNNLGSVLSDLRAMTVAGHEKYGDSCLKRGRTGLFLMLARKWDRIERAMEKHHYSMDDAIRNNPPPDGLLDDIQDLTVYLLILLSDLEANPLEEERRETQIKMPLKGEEGMEHPFGYDAGVEHG